MLCSMYSNMNSLIDIQKSIGRSLIYMLACNNYKVDKIVIGGRSYPDSLVPTLGFSYGQFNPLDLFFRVGVIPTLPVSVKIHHREKTQGRRKGGS